jgi:hypothetical protein|tara:strand:+ start:577 stop:804 length:228 start_codon:yes stop_codon:yes gene_type:complete
MNPFPADSRSVQQRIDQMMLVRTKVNDGFGDICCNAAKHSLQVQSDAAQAIAALAKGGFVLLSGQTHRKQRRAGI